jgi:hypothetical protein
VVSTGSRGVRAIVPFVIRGVLVDSLKQVQYKLVKRENERKNIPRRLGERDRVNCSK